MCIPRRNCNECWTFIYKHQATIKNEKEINPSRKEKRDIREMISKVFSLLSAEIFAQRSPQKINACES